MLSPLPHQNPSRSRKHKSDHEVFAGISYILIGVFSALAKGAVPACYVLFGSAILYLACHRSIRRNSPPGPAQAASAGGTVRMALPAKMQLYRANSAAVLCYSASPVWRAGAVLVGLLLRMIF